MSNIELPRERVLNTAFSDEGVDGVVKIDVFPIQDGDVLELVIESVNSTWRQGVWLRSDNGMLINGQQCPSATIWQDTAPDRVRMQCKTKDGCLHIYNVWDRGMGKDALAWSSGMLVEELANGRRYRCNDIGFETLFNKLVFRIERVSDA